MSRNNSFTWRLSLIIITIIDAIHRYIPSMSNPFISCTFCRKSKKALPCDLLLQYRTPGVRGIYHLRKVFLCAFSVVRQPIHIVQISPAYFALNLDVIRSSVLYCTQQNGRWGRMGFQPFSPLPPRGQAAPDVCFVIIIIWEVIHHGSA